MIPKRLVAPALLFVALFFLAPAQAAPNPAWTKPFPPFRIAGNLYYVGSEDLASYLIVTPKGDILLNSNLDSSPPLIRKSVEALGFHFSDIKILLISHAHYDHCAGSAEILRETRAKYEVMAPDVSVIESGGRTDFNYANDKSMRFPQAHVDRILHDGDTVSSIAARCNTNPDQIIDLNDLDGKFLCSQICHSLLSPFAVARAH